MTQNEQGPQSGAQDAAEHLSRSGGRSVVQRLQSLPPAVIYAVSLFIVNGFSFITIPLMAAYVKAGDYGQFDVAVSVVEAVLLIAGLGIGAQLIRFASVADTDEEQSVVARELLGTALVTFAVFAILVQLMAGWIAQSLELKLGMAALRMQLLAGAMQAVLELPIVWVRMKDRAWFYFFFAVGRTIVGVALMWWALASGYGVDGVMIVNSMVMVAGGCILACALYLETGVAVRWERFKQVAVYGAPIVGAGLCMFALGNLNRLFMAGSVDDVEIAHFGLAQRFAVAAYLLYAPFDMWWTPKRIALLQKPDGLRESAEYWSLGVAILLLAAGAVTLTAPIFVELALTEEYAGASDYVPALVASTTLLYLVMLSNTGIYARKTGFGVLAIDSVGALVALVGFALLIPTYGPVGALAAMFVGNFVRLGLYLHLGKQLAPIDYPWARVLLGVGATALVVWAAPPGEAWEWRLAYSVVTGLGLLATLFALGLMRPLEPAILKLLEPLRNVRRA